MALYLGSEKVKINLSGIEYALNIFSEKPIVNGVLMLTSEGYILTDADGVYITLKEDE